MTMIAKRRRGVIESLVLFVLAVSVTTIAALWAWNLSSSEFSLAPRVPRPGTIVVAVNGPHGGARDPLSIDLNFAGSIDQRTTVFDIVLTQRPDQAARDSDPYELLVFLCGAIAKNPHFVDSLNRQIEWRAPALEKGEVWSSSFGDVSQCVFTPVKMVQFNPSVKFRQAILAGSSGNPPNQVSGPKVLYALPGVVTVTATLPLGDLTPVPLPPKSSLTVGLNSVPIDLQAVTASPQFPDSGRLRWTNRLGSESRLPSEYRLAGELQDRQSSGQARIFFAGALLGVGGGAFIWALELLAGIRTAFFSEQHDPASQSAQAVSSGTDPDSSVTTLSTGERTEKFSQKRPSSKGLLVVSLVSFFAGCYFRGEIARRMHWKRKRTPGGR
ncbi:hypothetical protein [Nonomuraea sp. NEAU-A123]|uniref:hypothetical protein n=1 Tax=Nonomuraea sp. NEAU-A123 TaxID=2839649 RepID=UPI001BE3D076|nr:hypothetical protein [Nonomuraea sp. NEAU-A123]MBT2234998.1 hypothetical protein [Nonomuraea sp. NEAU-A123]